MVPARAFQTAVAGVLLLSSGCVATQQLRPPKVWVDPSFAEPVARRFATVAVLPFRGDGALARPMEELAGVRIREQADTGVMAPYHVERAMRRAVERGALPPEWALPLDRWVLDSVAHPKARPFQAEVEAAVRAIAAEIGADALLVGWVTRVAMLDYPGVPDEPVHTVLLLLDGRSGGVAALVWRVSRPPAAMLGATEAAFDATDEGIGAVLRLLEGEPGAAVPVAAPPPTRVPGGGEG